MESWPQGQYYDDCDVTFDGVEPEEDDPENEAVVEFSCGDVYAQIGDVRCFDLVEHFTQWEQGQRAATIVCRVPKDKLDEFTAMLQALGGSVSD